MLPLVAVAALILLAAVVAGPDARDGPPLDPGSTGPSGTRALVEVLGELGADVRATDEPAAAGGDTVLVLVDGLPDDERDDLRAWVEAGGTLVVADPGSPLSPDPVGTTELAFVDPSLARRCDVAALEAVDRVVAPNSAVLDVPEGATGCYPRGEGAWLVVVEEGEGAIVSLGGPGAFTNRDLREADNALLAVALLAPEPDAAVVVVPPRLPGEGEAGLFDLVGARVWLALAQLVVAFVVVVGWRARRLGRPVTEPQPVQLSGAELVVAVGNLLHQARARAQAARLLRDDLRRALAERAGLPAGTSPERVVEVTAARGVDARVLTGAAPADEDELRAMAAEIEGVRVAALGSSPVPLQPATDGPDHRDAGVGSAREHSP